MVHGEKILVTGPAGHLTSPIVRRLVEDNEVWGLARFSDPEARARLAGMGVTCVAKDLATDALSDP